MSLRVYVAVAVLTSFAFSSIGLAQQKSGSGKTKASSGKAKTGTKKEVAAKPVTPEKVGTLAYPQGRWQGLRVYNTPLEGIDADYEAKGVTILRVTDVPGLSAGAKITHYRVTDEGDYVAVANWPDLLESAREAPDNSIWIKGVDKNKHAFAIALDLISEDMWTAPDQNPELEGLIAGVTLKQDADAIVVTFARTGGALPIGAQVKGIYAPEATEPTPLDDLRALADYVVKHPADKLALAVLVADGVTSRVEVNVDPAVAKRWLGLEAPEAAPFPTCLKGIDGAKGGAAKVVAVKGNSPLKPGDVVTGVRLPGGTSFAQVDSWQELSDFLDAAGKPKAVDLRVVRASGETETLAKFPAR